MDVQAEREKKRKLLEQVKSGEISVEEAMDKIEATEAKRKVGRPKGARSEQAQKRSADMLVSMLVLEKRLPEIKNRQSKIRRHLAEKYNVEETTVDRVKANWRKIIKADRRLCEMGITDVMLEDGVAPEMVGLLLPNICDGVLSGEIQKVVNVRGFAISISNEMVNKINKMESAKNSLNIIPMIGHLFG